MPRFYQRELLAASNDRRDAKNPRPSPAAIIPLYPIIALTTEHAV